MNKPTATSIPLSMVSKRGAQWYVVGGVVCVATYAEAMALLHPQALVECEVFIKKAA